MGSKSLPIKKKPSTIASARMRMEAEAFRNSVFTTMGSHPTSLLFGAAIDHW